jgi:hypothetical protein
VKRFNPLHCGAVVASRSSAPDPATPGSGFNPLHCGAVVASGRGGSAGAAGPGFNPLHCGAVVASSNSSRRWPASGRFQSPSLRGSGRFRRRRGDASASGRWFQSPSLRGSGRFTSERSLTHCAEPWFQSPSLRGSGRFLAEGLGADRTGVSHACCFLRLRPAGAHACRPGRCGTPGWRRVGRTANTRSTNLVHRSGPTPR